MGAMSIKGEKELFAHEEYDPFAFQICIIYTYTYANFQDLQGGDRKDKGKG